LIDRYITSKSTKNRELQNLAESKKPICQKHKQNPNNTERRRRRRRRRRIDQTPIKTK
jgi:predicted outer membrane protein